MTPEIFSTFLLEWYACNKAVMIKAIPFSLSALLVFAGVWTCSAAITAPGQQADTKSLDDLFLSFYQDPRPERLEGFIDKWLSSSSGDKWDAYPPLAGFLAIDVAKETLARIGWS